MAKSGDLLGNEPGLRRAPSGLRWLNDSVLQARGLDGKSDDSNTVLDKTTEPDIKARYDRQKIKRSGV